MKTRNYILIAVAALGILFLSLGSTNTSEEVIIEDPIEVEDWMTQPFITQN